MGRALSDLTYRSHLTILRRMAPTNVTTIKRLVAIAFMVMAIVAFNLSRPSLKNDLLTSFNEWYQGASPLLQAPNDSKQADLSLKISISLSSRAGGNKPSVWSLPARSLLEPEDRENTARILQLIRESGVFGLRPVSENAGHKDSIHFSIKDGEQQFEISVPFEEVENNIQVKNLLKLLDVYANTPPPSDVEPARL